MTTTYFGAMLVNVTNIELSIINLKTGKETERVRSNVGIGENIFNHEAIAFETVTDAAEALHGFLQILKDYGVDDYRLWGSQTLSTASNAEFVRDQLFVRTGLHIHWLSAGEESFVRNEAIGVHLKKYHKLVKDHAAIIGLNSGSVTMSLFKNGQLALTRNMKLGPVRIKEVLQELRMNATSPVEVLNDYIDSQVDDFYRLLPDDDISTPHHVILVGATPLNDHFIAPNENAREFSRDQINQFVTMASRASDQYLMDYLGLNEDDIQLILPEVLLIQKLLNVVNAQDLTLVSLNVLDGLAVNHALQLKYRKDTFDDQMIAAATELSDRYNVEPRHRDIVVRFALHLFDQLKSLHQLGPRDRLLLQIAAIVHDIGGYIDPHAHYLHSDYILQVSELLGLSSEETQIVAAIARYHSTQTPSEDLAHFERLSPDRRVIVGKLAAILRVADALDDDHQQKIANISVSIKPPRVIITATSDQELALVRWVFSFKAKFFEEVFGLKPVLKQRRQHK